MKHTPGPWVDTGESTDKRTPRYIRSQPRSGMPAPAVATIPSALPYSERDANARLIAAAPELLAAAKAFVEAWDKCLQLERTDVALRLARAAIAKAEGTPPC